MPMSDYPIIPLNDDELKLIRRRLADETDKESIALHAKVDHYLNRNMRARQSRRRQHQ